MTLEGVIGRRSSAAMDMDMDMDMEWKGRTQQER